MPQRPNILIVMTDHQRADTVLPTHPAITPNVVRLGEQGVTFTRTFCPSPHCCPARATFMSGLYPSGHGVWNNVCNDMALSRGLNDGVRLWSEDLAAAGYELHYTGKWHVSAVESPADRGWTEHGVSGTGSAHHGVRREHYRQNAEEMNRPESRGEGEILRPGYGTYRLYGTRPDDSRIHDDDVTDTAVELLPELADTAVPWCLYVGLTCPHDPYCVAQKYLDMIDLADVPLPPSFADEMADKPRVYGRMRATRFAGQLTEREVREGIRHFWAVCAYIDDQFGRILTTLEESGAAENTVVLFCSDHGDYCGEHGLFAKGIPCFRGAYHVPAVVRWPAGLARPGRRVDHFVSLADFAPTFLELAGVGTDRHFTGASLLPFIEDRKPANWRDDIHTQCNGVELYFTQRSVTTDRYKYVFNGFDVDELYDLQDDPGEMRNLAAQPGCDTVIRDMCRRMWRFALAENDAAINPYITVSLAPYGPAEAFRPEQ